MDQANIPRAAADMPIGDRVDPVGMSDDCVKSGTDAIDTIASRIFCRTIAGRAAVAV